MPDTERTEPATPHRRREARQRGQVAKSIEINSALILLGGFLGLLWFGKFTFFNLMEVMRIGIIQIKNLRFATENFTLPLINLVVVTVGFMLFLVVIATVGNILQVGFINSWFAIKPQFSRINPILGLRRFFSYRILIELLKSIIKIVITAAIAYIMIKNEISKIFFTIDMSPLQSFILASSLFLKVGIRLGLIFLVFGVIDYIYQRWEYERSLRMTKQEVKEEIIRYEGRPEVRQRIRTLQRQFAMRRMMQEVPKADVVITNPTELAIALYYEPKEMIAPKVIAKGRYLIAKKIVEIAKSCGIPTVENRPLAQLLFKFVDVGQFIPLELYQAVAEVLAYLYRIGKAKRKWF